MAPPPAKRQRKLLLSSENGDQSDDDRPASRKASFSRSSATKAQPLPSKTKPGKATIKSPKSRKAAAISSPNVSPAKRKERQKASKENEQSKSLHTFFKPATEEERWNAKETKSTTNGVTEDLVEDQIEDDSSDEASLNMTRVRSDSSIPLDRRKLQRGQSSLAESLVDSAPLSASQRFVKDIELAPGPASPSITYRTWAERFPPESLAEIALHKKKLADVHQCLADMLDGRMSQKVLVLKGPAGSGKSTLVSLLSQVLRFSVVEWRSPSPFEAGNSTSLASQLEDFLIRSGHFGNLLTDVPDAAPSSPRVTDFPPTKRVMMIEEFPAFISGTSSALSAFRNVLLRYLSSAHSAVPPAFNARKNTPSHPAVVIIVSETLSSSSVGSSEAFTAHRLLGPDILNHPRARTIEFNATAPSFVSKALELTLKKEARCSKRRRIPGPAVIKRLSECGDIRSAINSLEFMCLRREEGSAWSGRVAAKTTKKSGVDGIALTEMEKESLELLTQREAVIGMFHAVGKVVYNKRELPASGTEPQTQPPRHLEQHARPLSPQTSVDKLVDEIGTDIQTFIATLHENYILSCKSPSFVDTLAGCSGQLSDADILSADRPHASRRFGGSHIRNSTIDTIRQNEIGFQVAARGLLFALPSPVSRAEHPKGRKVDSFKMFFPTSLRLWKISEEIDGLIDRWLVGSISHQRVDTFDPARVDGSMSEGVASWKSWSRTLDQPAEDDGDDDQPQTRILTSKYDMLLERLPYMKYRTSRERHTKQDIERIATFGGLGLHDEESSDDESIPGHISANELASDMLSPQRAGKWKERTSSGSTKTKTGENTEKNLEKLYISDDDIED